LLGESVGVNIVPLIAHFFGVFSRAPTSSATTARHGLRSSKGSHCCTGRVCGWVSVLSCPNL
jgi:hypothetical protein